MLTAPAIDPDALDLLIEQLGLLDPTDTQAGARSAAPRLVSLAGRRIGLLDNRKPNAALLLHLLGQLLEARHGAAESLARSKFIYSQPAAPNLIDELAGCDAVVTAIGD